MFDNNNKNATIEHISNPRELGWPIPDAGISKFPKLTTALDGQIKIR